MKLFRYNWFPRTRQAVRKGGGIVPASRVWHYHGLPTALPTEYKTVWSLTCDSGLLIYFCFLLFLMFLFKKKV
jgi:hypothetical protein